MKGVLVHEHTYCERSVLCDSCYPVPFMKEELIYQIVDELGDFIKFYSRIPNTPWGGSKDIKYITLLPNEPCDSLCKAFLELIPNYYEKTACGLDLLACTFSFEQVTEFLRNVDCRSENFKRVQSLVTMPKKSIIQGRAYKVGPHLYCLLWRETKLGKDIARLIVSFTLE